jgi:drug/metabolite transporter (DMT)-like permease
MTARAWLALTVLSALWGAVYLLIEITLRELSPPLIVLGRVAFAAAILVPLALRRSALQPLLRRPRVVIEVVLVQATIPLLLLTYGQETVTSALAGILVGAQPLFVALLALRWAPEERPEGWPGALGVGLGLLGLILLFGLDLTNGATALVGGLLVLLAAFCYAAGAVMIHRRLHEADPLGIAAAAMLVSTAALVLPGSLTLPGHIPAATTLVTLVVLGTVCTGMTLAMFYGLIVSVGPARAALAFYLSPAFAVIFGWALLRERITLTTIVGLVAIVAGSALAARRAEMT